VSLLRKRKGSEAARAKGNELEVDNCDDVNWNEQIEDGVR